MVDQNRLECLRSLFFQARIISRPGFGYNQVLQFISFVPLKQIMDKQDKTLGKFSTLEVTSRTLHDVQLYGRAPGLTRND
jgi:hypothetical protein